MTKKPGSKYDKNVEDLGMRTMPGYEAKKLVYQSFIDVLQREADGTGDMDDFMAMMYDLGDLSEASISMIEKLTWIQIYRKVSMEAELNGTELPDEDLLFDEDEYRKHCGLMVTLLERSLTVGDKQAMQEMGHLFPSEAEAAASGPLEDLKH